MPPKARKKELVPHTDQIIEWLAVFRSPEEICQLLQDRGVVAVPDDIVPFTVGQYRKRIEKRSDQIAANLPIAKRSFWLMKLNDIVCGESSPAETLSAIRISTKLLDEGDVEDDPTRLVEDDE